MEILKSISSFGSNILLSNMQIDLKRFVDHVVDLSVRTLCRDLVLRMANHLSLWLSAFEMSLRLNLFPWSAPLPTDREKSLQHLEPPAC